MATNTPNSLDLFYPNVLGPDLKLDGLSVQDAFRRTFDSIYKINPPTGSPNTSSVTSTNNFGNSTIATTFSNIVALVGEHWQSNTNGYSWNAHTLIYHGVNYKISAGSGTSRYIYWKLANSSLYQTSSTFPDLSGTNPIDNSTADALIAVWDSTTGKLYPFWANQIAPGYISDILVNNVSATKITTGTLAANVTITLTQSDTTPAMLIWQNTAEMFAKVTNTEMRFVPLTDNSASLRIGETATPLHWKQVIIDTSQGITLADNENLSTGVALSIKSSNQTFEFDTQISGPSISFFMTKTTFYSTNSGGTFLDLGTSSNPWNNLIVATGHGMKDSGSNSSFVVTSTVAQIYASGAVQVAEFATAGAGASNIKLYVNNGLQSVSLGVADSGGAGFRLLRVPN